MKAIKKAVCVTGKYTDRNGQEKNQYATVGKLLQRDDGSVCLKMDSIPVNFTGWVNFYDLDENRKDNYQQGMAQAKQAAQPEPAGFEDSDVPF